MPFPLYLDDDVHPIVARILRGRGFDAVSANEADHCGIVVSDQLEIGELVRRMTKVLGNYSASDMINRFVWLQSFA